MAEKKDAINFQFARIVEKSVLLIVGKVQQRQQAWIEEGCFGRSECHFRIFHGICEIVDTQMVLRQDDIVVGLVHGTADVVVDNDIAYSVCELGKKS